MTSREFWRLSLEEFMWLWDLRRPAKVLFAGTPNAMTEDEAAALMARTYGD